MLETKQIHFEGKYISRNKGQSAVASAAYRSGEKIYFEYEGITFDYTRKSHIAYSEIFLPEYAPEIYRDRGTLWNAVENFETTKNALLARSIEFSLPTEIPLKDSIQAAREMAEYYRAQGMCVDLNIHNPCNDTPNPHCHLLLTLRPFNEDGTFVRHKSHRVYILDENGEKIPLPNGKDYKTKRINVVDWDNRENMEKWRTKWAQIEQKYLKKQGHRIKVEHRSFKRQGIHRIPTVHMGPDVTAMERKGIHTHVGDLNREIRAINETLEKYDKMEQELDLRIYKLQRLIERTSSNQRLESLETSPPQHSHRNETNTDSSSRPAAQNVIAMLTEFQNNRDQFILDKQIHQRLVSKTKNPKRFTDLYAFLSERKIESLDDLSQAIQNEKSVRRVAIQNQHRNIDEQKKYAQLLDAAEAFKPYRKYYRKYESLTGKEKEKYRKRYAQEIEQANLRLKAIQHYSGKSLYQPSKWKERLEELQQERRVIDEKIRTTGENIELFADLTDLVKAVQVARYNAEEQSPQRTDANHSKPQRTGADHSKPQRTGDYSKPQRADADHSKRSRRTHNERA